MLQEFYELLIFKKECICITVCMFSRLIGRGEARLVVATLTLAEIECHHPTSALCVIVNIPKSGASDFLLTYISISFLSINPISFHTSLFIERDPSPLISEAMSIQIPSRDQSQVLSVPGLPPLSSRAALGSEGLQHMNKTF